LLEAVYPLKLSSPGIQLTEVSGFVNNEPTRVKRWTAGMKTPYMSMSFRNGGRPRETILKKILRFLYILYSLQVGVVLLWLPLTGLWDNNHILYLYPQLAVIVSNPFFKGAILGLGINNLLVGISELARFQAFPRP
jgi:hypothetical protein